MNSSETSKDDDFWATDPTVDIKKEEVGFAHAGKIVNSTDVVEGDHVFFNLADVPKIDKYFRSIVPAASSLYEGSWLVGNEFDAHDENGTLQQAFGAENSDQDGEMAVTHGRVRSFIYRSKLHEATDFFSGGFLSGHTNTADDDNSSDET